MLFPRNSSVNDRVAGPWCNHQITANILRPLWLHSLLPISRIEHANLMLPKLFAGSRGHHIHPRWGSVTRMFIYNYPRRKFECFITVKAVFNSCRKLNVMPSFKCHWCSKLSRFFCLSASKLWHLLAIQLQLWTISSIFFSFALFIIKPITIFVTLIYLQITVWAWRLC